MKLSDYAKQAGVSYQTAWRWWKSGALKGYQLPSGTIIVNVSDANPIKQDPIVCIYARVSSIENKDSLDEQAERLTQYSIAKGYQIYKIVKEVGSGLDDNRQQLANILTDKNYNILLVEHRDSLARFSVNYIKILLEELGKSLEVVNEAENGHDELIQDLASIITSFATSLYGKPYSRRKTERLIQELHKKGDIE